MKKGTHSDYLTDTKKYRSSITS